MKPQYLSTTIIVLFALVVSGAGYYLTGVRQTEEMQAIEDATKLARMQKAEVEQLLVEESTTIELADEAVRKWRARYKYIPVEMNTPDILDYLESLTRRGFESFNISLGGIQTQQNFKQYTFDVTGTAYYSNLYDFIWHIENNRAFYRISDLSMQYTPISDLNEETGVDRHLDMVSFSFTLDAYFAGAEGLSTSEEALMPVPRHMLPAHDPAHNSFYPHVRTTLPSNDELLINMEESKLVSVIGSRAIVEDSRGQHLVTLGDKVYLGEIVTIDPIGIRVVARLNKGGVMREVTLELEAPGTEIYRRAEGDTQVRPIESDQ